MKVYKILPLIALILFSCEKDLDFEYHEIEPLTVVEGTLTDAGATVSITQTTPMDEPFSSSHITDATVELVDLSGGDTWQLSPGENGLFSAPVCPTVGHEYELRVSNGRDYYSARSTMLSPTQILSLEFNWIDMLGKDVAALQVVLKDNRRNDHEMYWIRAYRNGMGYSWNLVGKRLNISDTLTEVIMTTQRDPDDKDDKNNLFDGDIVKVTVTPICEEMFDYLFALLYTGSNGQRMYEGDFCLGYFLASPVATAEIVYHPDEIARYK